MEHHTLDASMKAINRGWGPLSTEVVAACSRHLQNLVNAPITHWAASKRFISGPVFGPGQ